MNNNEFTIENAGEYAYVYVGNLQVHIKREGDGVVVDIWNHDATSVLDSAYTLFEEGQDDA